jgi:hypothetical protein
MKKILILGVFFLAATFTWLGLPPSAAGQSGGGHGTAGGTGGITVQPASNVPPGLGWTDITGQQQDGHCPPNGFGGFGYNFADFCNGVVDAWGSGIADTKRNRMWFMGGGHTDYAGNELYYFDLNTLTVARADDPANPTPTCVVTYSNGTPSSRHTYGGITYIPGSDVMFLFGGGGFCPAGFASSDTWTLNLSQVGSGGMNGWMRMDSTLGNGGVHPCGDFNNSQSAYDPNTQLVFVNDLCGGSGLWTYNFTTNSYTQRSAAAANMTLHEDIVIDPSRKLLLRFGDGTAQKINIATGSSYAVVNLTGTGCAALMNASNPGLAFDSIQNLIVGWPNFGPTVYLYNPDTDSCTTETFIPNAPPDSHQQGPPSTSNGTFGRWQYFPAFNIYVIINEWNIDVHTLRLTNAASDFAARCAGAGVIRCEGFDTNASITGTIAPGKNKILSGLTTPSIDNGIYASGGGSLHFVVPPAATQANTSGQYWIDFKDDYSIQSDSLVNGDPLSLTTACGGSPCPNEIWVQWRQRFDPGMLQIFAGSNGWKQMILGEGDNPGAPAFSCSDIDLVVENSNQMGIPRMYHSCGVKLDEFDPLTVDTGRNVGGAEVFSPQNQAGGYLNCTYVAEQNIPTIPPCVPYVTNQWMTFQMHVKVGTWFPTGSPPTPSAPFKHDSLIQLYVAQEGQPSTLVINFLPGATSPACDNQQSDIPSCQTGYDLANPTAFPFPCVTGSTCQLDGFGNKVREKFGQVILLPYQTNLNCPACTGANTWYDELIISKNQIPDPKF